MCNRYAVRATVSQIRQLSQELGMTLSTTPATDNLPEMDIYPDKDAPVITLDETGGLILEMMRWGFPPIPGKKKPITNIRNLQSRWWRDANREWMIEARYRCLVPFSAFAEPPHKPTWFAVPDLDTAYFAGVWRPWTGERLKEQPGKTRRARETDDWRLFAFLTTEANSIVRPIHENAMPVILTTPAEYQTWIKGGQESLEALQRPLPDHLLHMTK